MALSAVGAPCTGNTGVINVGAITGGSPAYQYNLNGGLFQTGTSFTGLAPGTYTVGVKDINNCTFTTWREEHGGDELVMTDTLQEAAIAGTVGQRG